MSKRDWRRLQAYAAATPPRDSLAAAIERLASIRDRCAPGDSDAINTALDALRGMQEAAQC